VTGEQAAAVLRALGEGFRTSLSADEARLWWNVALCHTEADVGMEAARALLLTETAWCRPAQFLGAVRKVRAARAAAAAPVPTTQARASPEQARQAIAECRARLGRPGSTDPLSERRQASSEPPVTREP
jgi:hypothetical protein